MCTLIDLKYEFKTLCAPRFRKPALWIDCSNGLRIHSFKSWWSNLDKNSISLSRRLLIANSLSPWLVEAPQTSIVLSMPYILKYRMYGRLLLFYPIRKILCRITPLKISILFFVTRVTIYDQNLHTCEVHSRGLDFHSRKGVITVIE